jgi:hypothetical protein
MRRNRLRGSTARDVLSGRPLGLLAVGLVGIEAGLAAVGETVPALSAAVLLAAPGLALVPLLPVALRASRLATLAAAPALGFAATSIALISLARTGIPIDEWSTRAVLATLVLGGLLAHLRRGEIVDTSTGSLGEAIGLVVALAAGVVLSERVLGGSPVPGNDWAKYVLYADEVRRQGSLLIDNPFWMLGVPFREDPGVPSVYGAFLVMTGEPAGVLAHGIWAFAVMGILSTFAYARAVWGPATAVLAALLWAVLPINQDILGWHGLANLAALGVLPLVLMYLTLLARDGLRGREAAGFAVVLVALAATHRLSAGVGLAAVALGLVVLLAGASRGRRRRTVTGALRTGAALLAMSPLVASDLVERGSTFGGTQSYTVYLLSKVDLDLVARDLTWPFVVTAVFAVALALVLAWRDRSLVAPLCALAVITALAYAWVLHVPLAYLRMAYFLPLVLTVIVAAVAMRLAGPRLALAGGAALAIAIGAIGWGQAANVKRFYSFATPASLRGLDAVAARLRPNEVVVTDRCWSFLTTWLLHTRTLPALAPQDIQPKAELPMARAAQEVLRGTRRGRARARQLGIRFVLVDPTCTDPNGRPLPPPALGRAVFVSARLAVVELPRTGARRPTHSP